MSDFVTQPIAAMASGRGSRGGWSRLGRAAAQAGRDALYLTIGMLTSIVAFAVWVTGVTLSVSLAIFIVGLPVILATAVAFRWTADLDRLNAAILRGGRIRARYRDHRGERFFSRLWSTLGDAQTWKDFSWLVVHSVVGFAFGTIAISLVATVVGLAFLPVWYWSIPDGVQLDLWTVDTLGEALASALLAIPVAVAAAGVLRAMALGESGLASALLGRR